MRASRPGRPRPQNLGDNHLLHWKTSARWLMSISPATSSQSSLWSSTSIYMVFFTKNICMVFALPNKGDQSDYWQPPRVGVNHLHATISVLHCYRRSSRLSCCMDNEQTYAKWWTSSPRSDLSFWRSRRRQMLLGLDIKSRVRLGLRLEANLCQWELLSLHPHPQNW